MGGIWPLPNRSGHRDIEIHTPLTAVRQVPFLSYQTCVLTKAPLMFCPLLKSCDRFCKNDCSVAVPVVEVLCPDDEFNNPTKFWKLEFKLLSVSELLPCVLVELA